MALNSICDICTARPKLLLEGQQARLCSCFSDFWHVTYSPDSTNTPWHRKPYQCAEFHTARVAHRVTVSGKTRAQLASSLADRSRGCQLRSQPQQKLKREELGVQSDDPSRSLGDRPKPRTLSGTVTPLQVLLLLCC